MCALQGVREVEEWMSQTSGIPLEELRPHMFLLRDRDATSHLMRCAPHARYGSLLCRLTLPVSDNSRMSADTPHQQRCGSAGITVT